VTDSFTTALLNYIDDPLSHFIGPAATLTSRYVRYTLSLTVIQPMCFSENELSPFLRFILNLKSQIAQMAVVYISVEQHHESNVQTANCLKELSISGGL